MTRTAGWESNNTLQCLEQHQAHLLLALGDYAPGTPVAYATFVDTVSKFTVLYCTVLYYRTYCSVLVRTYCTILNCTVLYCAVLYCTHKFNQLLFTSIALNSNSKETESLTIIEWHTCIPFHRAQLPPPTPPILPLSTSPSKVHQYPQSTSGWRKRRG